MKQLFKQPVAFTVMMLLQDASAFRIVTSRVLSPHFESPLLKDNILLKLRAGAAGGESQKKKAKTKRKKKSASLKKSTTAVKEQDREKALKEEKEQISGILKEKDAAEALGDAIRERAHELRFETTNPVLEGIEQSVTSVSWAMGASDQRTEDDGGGVEAAPASVLVHYFLKSHGGAHALQCVCSLLATVAGLGAIFLSKNNALSLTLIKRCMLFAMVKHVSGLLAASFLTARAIPEVGLRKARVWMEELVTDPVSQYVFYAACILVWLPNNPAPVKAASDASTAPETSPAVWWQSYPIVPIMLVGPVVLRELVSTALVISDVLILWTFSTGKSNAFSQALLRTGESVVNAVMSILATPKVWRSANAAQRQAILAKLVSKVSLFMEVAVGVLMVADVVWSLTEFTFANMSQRPPVGQLAKRLLCTRLYLHFLWTRKRKIQKLATAMRGGASQFPLYVLQVLMDPIGSMGISDDETTRSKQWTSRDDDQLETEAEHSYTWKDYLWIGLGLDNDDASS